MRQAALAALGTGLGVTSDAVHLSADSQDLPGRIIRFALPASGTIVVSAVEHSSILSAADDFLARGGQVRTIGVDHQGRIDIDEYRAALPGADLAFLQTANHEVGTRQPVDQIARACAQADVPLVLDASTSLGHDPTPTDWSILLGQASSWGGPPGTGLLAIRDARLRRRIFREVPAAALPEVITAARGWEWVLPRVEAEAERARHLTDQVLTAATSVPDVLLLGDPVDRLPHLVAFSCLYVDGEALVLGLDQAGFAISSGSSCVSDTRRPSHVLAAMGALTQGNVRVSLPYGATDETVDGFAHALPGVVAQARAMLGAPVGEAP